MNGSFKFPKKSCWSENCVAQQIRDFVSTVFQGDYKKAFDHYDKNGNKDGQIGRRELEQLVDDLFNGWTKGKIADGIMETSDKGKKDGKISWGEFQTGLNKLLPLKKQKGR